MVEGGYSTHGTGDMLGGAGAVGYEENFARFFSLRAQVGVTLHGRWALGAPTLTQQYTSGTPYFTTTGVQVAGLAVFHVTGFTKQYLNVIVGPLVRYQMTSYPDSYGYWTPTPLYPNGFYTFGKTDAQTVALGYRVVLESQLVQTPKLSFGIQAGFQNDTEGDVLTNLGVVIRRKWSAPQKK